MARLRGWGIVRTLHITNGDAAARLIRESGLGGDILPWRDILHDGPVPAGLTLADLRPFRARFLANCGFAGHDDAMRDLETRDSLLAAASEFDEVVLWFEPDLYDQLQLLQVLDWFAAVDVGATRLSLVCVDTVPGVARFRGFGPLSPAAMAELGARRTTVQLPALEAGRRAWAAFRAANPAALLAIAHDGEDELPFVAAAFRRHLAEFPDVRDGLARSEREILAAIARSPGVVLDPAEIFAAVDTAEDAPFLGDWSVWLRIERLASGRSPLLAIEGAEDGKIPRHADPDRISAISCRVTDAGRAVLAGDAHAVTLNGIDRWLGGVHLVSD